MTGKRQNEKEKRSTEWLCLILTHTRNSDGSGFKVKVQWIINRHPQFFVSIGKEINERITQTTFLIYFISGSSLNIELHRMESIRSSWETQDLTDLVFAQTCSLQWTTYGFSSDGFSEGCCGWLNHNRVFTSESF